MGNVGYEEKNWVVHLVNFAVRVAKAYQRAKDSLPGRIIAYYALPRPKRHKKSRDAI